MISCSTSSNNCLISQRRGVICLIPKDDSDLTELSNWRPLTLRLNVDYKILAKSIGQRIESKLSLLIHSDKTGFIKGRFIGQNVWLLNDMMDYTEAKNLPGILLFGFLCSAYRPHSQRQSCQCVSVSL